MSRSSTGLLEATSFSLVAFYPLLTLPYSFFLGYMLIYVIAEMV